MTSIQYRAGGCLWLNELGGVPQWYTGRQSGVKDTAVASVRDATLLAPQEYSHTIVEASRDALTRARQTSEHQRQSAADIPHGASHPGLQDQEVIAQRGAKLDAFAAQIDEAETHLDSQSVQQVVPSGIEF